MSPELEEAIAKAREHKMTAREKFEQRVSFVYGSQGMGDPGMTKQQVRELLADSMGYPEEWKDKP